MFYDLCVLPDKIKYLLKPKGARVMNQYVLFKEKIDKSEKNL
jgi:hypothetical protein